MKSKDDIELRDETIFPDETVLRTVLGTSYNAYTRLLDLFHHNEMTYEWRFYRDGKAWLCKVQRKKKTIIWMSARKGFIRAVIYFAHKHMHIVYDSDISDTMKDAIRSTDDVGKSKPCIFEIRNATILSDLEKVMLLKIVCK